MDRRLLSSRRRSPPRLKALAVLLTSMGSGVREPTRGEQSSGGGGGGGGGGGRGLLSAVARRRRRHEPTSTACMRPPPPRRRRAMGAACLASTRLQPRPRLAHLVLPPPPSSRDKDKEKEEEEERKAKELANGAQRRLGTPSGPLHASAAGREGVRSTSRTERPS